MLFSAKRSRRRSSTSQGSPNATTSTTPTSAPNTTNPPHTPLASPASGAHRASQLPSQSPSSSPFRVSAPASPEELNQAAPLSSLSPASATPAPHSSSAPHSSPASPAEFDAAITEVDKVSDKINPWVAKQKNALRAKEAAPSTLPLLLVTTLVPMMGELILKFVWKKSTHSSEVPRATDLESPLSAVLAFSAISTLLGIVLGRSSSRLFNLVQQRRRQKSH